MMPMNDNIQRLGYMSLSRIMRTIMGRRFISDSTCMRTRRKTATHRSDGGEINNFNKPLNKSTRHDDVGLYFYWWPIWFMAARRTHNHQLRQWQQPAAHAHRPSKLCVDSFHLSGVTSAGRARKEQIGIHQRQRCTRDQPLSLAWAACIMACRHAPARDRDTATAKLCALFSVGWFEPSSYSAHERTNYLLLCSSLR